MKRKNSTLDDWLKSSKSKPRGDDGGVVGVAEINGEPAITEELDLSEEPEIIVEEPEIGDVTLAVVDSIKERCLQWIGRERKLTLILTLILTLTLTLILILNTNPKH